MTRVLLVDDHPMVRHGLNKILASYFVDAEFGEASTSAEALELLGRERWDLALVDLRLPDRDGLALLEELRQSHPQVPALVVSAYPEEEFAMRCLRLGAAGYLTKTSSPDELTIAVRKALEGGKYVTAALAEKLAQSLGQGEPVPAHELLSGRELQVLRLVASGKSLKQIASELGLSEKTIATYRTRISSKLGLSTNVELTRYALRNRLID